MEEGDGAPSGRSSPPTPKKIKMESEEPKEIIKVEDHSEDESEEIEVDDEEEDGSPQLPPLLDMIDLPLPSPLPPTPPLPSSPRDLNMEQQDSEDEGPPPGWDNPYQHKEQVEQRLTPEAISSDIKMEDVQEDAYNGDGAAPEVVASDNKVGEQDSEDEGPPPGWDSKCHPEPELQVACPTPTITRPDKKTEDVQKDTWNRDSPQPQLTSPVPSDIKMEEQESEDEGPPPGWDSKCQPEPELQTPCPTMTQSDMKTEGVQQDGPNGDGCAPAVVESADKRVEEEDEGAPPGWDSKCHPQAQPELTITESDVKPEENIQQDDPQPSHQSPTPQVVAVPSDMKMEEHESEEEEGAPPGWDSKFQPPNQTTPPSEPNKIEDDEGPPPGWPQQQAPSPVLASGGARMEWNVEAIVERPRPQPTPPKHHSLTPIKQQRPPLPSLPTTTTTTTNNPEMGQMVCGSCRRLLSYPKGARYVECGCCLEENYVLQEDQLGQVICGGCDVLLMYPYGAPKVRCVNCSTETEIGDQNRRPPLSQQQQRARRHLKRVQTSNC